jgi:hypothetical protein
MGAKKRIEAALAAASRGDVKRYDLTVPGACRCTPMDPRLTPEPWMRWMASGC